MQELSPLSQADIQELEQAARTGMIAAWHAARQPEVLAIGSKYGNRTFAQLNARANQFAQRLREAGLQPGDAIAVVTRNRPEFIEAMLAAYRIGLRFTPINFHLKSEEIGYIVDNCGAKAFLADATLGDLPVAASTDSKALNLRLSAGGDLDGFVALDTHLDGAATSDIDQPLLGQRMLYTSGTTGRPKGVFRKEAVPEMPQWDGTPTGYRRGLDRNLCTGPAYHAAPLMFDIARPLTAGAGVIMMDRWDAEEALRLIQDESITHTHMVATMFHRLLNLPDATRAQYSTDSLRFLIHGAAPCPVHIKQSMIDWLGPIIWEYYAATEGGGGFFVGSEEWLQKPGTVGCPGPEFDNKILDDNGEQVDTGKIGTIYMRAPAVGRFEYYNDTEKTGKTYRGDYFTLGDMGYFDEDGYLFLTGRSAELIISGGVNIYPQEIDSEIIKHPAVLDVCTVGIPNDEWGEEVLTVVQLNEGHSADDALSEDLISWARERLANYKCPRRIAYSTELPRLPSGKILRRQVRDSHS